MLTRVKDLINSSQSCNPKNFFYEFVKRDELNDPYLDSLERDFSQLSNESWEFFKAKCLKKACCFHPKNYWIDLWNTFNEVKGYIYLKEAGFDEIEFLQEGELKTPDFKGISCSGSAILEVKNLNRSEYDTFWTIFPEIKASDSSINQAAIECVKKKLREDCIYAEQQIAEYCQKFGNVDRKICYFVIDLDIYKHSAWNSIIESLIDNVRQDSKIEIECFFVDRQA